MATNLTLMQQFSTLFYHILAKWHSFAHSALYATWELHDKDIFIYTIRINVICVNAKLPMNGEWHKWLDATIQFLIIENYANMQTH